MIKLLNIEFLKVKNYHTFWWIMGIYAVLVPCLFYGLSQIDFPFFPSDSEIFGFPTVWNYVTWSASWFNIILGVLVVILVCNDISYKTQRQGVIDGLSKRDVILGKVYFFVALALIITIYTFLIGVLFGVIYSNPASLFSGIEYLGIYFVQTLGYFAFAFFFAVLIRKSALSIILFVVILMVDGILKFTIPLEIAQLVPTITFSDLTPFPFFRQLMDIERAQDPDFEAPLMLSQTLRSVLSIVYVTGFILIGYVSLKRRDL